MIPNTDFITTFLNIRDSDLEYFFVSTENSKTYYNVQLKRKLFPVLIAVVKLSAMDTEWKQSITLFWEILTDTSNIMPIDISVKAVARLHNYYRQELKNRGISQSMSRRGNCWQKYKVCIILRFQICFFIYRFCINKNFFLILIYFSLSLVNCVDIINTSFFFTQL